MKPTLQRSLFDWQDDSGPLQQERPAAPPRISETGVITTPGTVLVPPHGKAQTVACVNPGDCDWVSFIRNNDRIPLIEDSRKPWQYQGWLMYYRILCEEHLDIPKRWDYWFRTMAEERLLDEPIPEIHFANGGFGDRSEGYKMIDQWVRLVDRYGQGWSSPMTVLLDWLLWGFGLSSEEPVVAPDLNEQLYRSVNLGPLLLNPGDYLGEWIASQKGRWNPNAFYPTPHHVVEMMVQMNFTGVDPVQARSMTVCDPCLGSGRMLLHSSSYSLRLFGTDIDNDVIKAAKVNGALYAPWLVRPFPEELFHRAGTSHASSRSTS